MINIAKNINILGRFCGKRDIKSLSKKELKYKYGIEQVDIVVLFGGSILCGGDVLCDAIKNNIAKKFIIVGGHGHTTEILRKKVQDKIPTLDLLHLSEAEIFSSYIKYKYNYIPDFLECKSTNCGNNITYLLSLLESNNIPFQSIILLQDATMQNRMDAGLRKYVHSDTLIINYAVYQAEVIVENNTLKFSDSIYGMWDIEKYISLLMGEIPRLMDNINGYGPKGKKYIAHVDIPSHVLDSFNKLEKIYPSLVRKANPIYASKY